MRKSINTLTTNQLLAIIDQVGNYLPIGIMLADLNGEVFYRNATFDTWLTDYPIEDKLWFVQMQPYLDNSKSNSKEFENRTHSIFIEKNYTHEADYVVNWQNHRVFFRIKTYPLYNEENNICGLIEITENVTDYKQMEYSLHQSRRFETVGRLASGIAHDFNNILQVINGHSEMLLDTHKDDPKLLRSLDVILSSGQKASALTRQLLLFSRRQQNEFKHINLGILVSNMHKIICRMLGEDICMKINQNDANIYIEGDESQIEQIIMNLAINSRDAMPEGGEINITIDTCEIFDEQRTELGFLKPGRYVILSFIDTGIGMSPDIMEHIFEPFFTTKETGHGTGLGLATVYSIVKQHQGFIQVQSAPGKGTAFTIYFPYFAAQKFLDQKELEELCTTGGAESILIIEDDENVRDLASQVLTHYGYQVMCVSNLTQAYELVEKQQFDLFLIDIVLPDGNGVDFIEVTKKKQPQAAYILSSGYTEDKSQIKHTLEKGYSFLHKPYTINALLNTCREAIQSSRNKFMQTSSK